MVLYILPRNGDAGLGGGLLADIDMRWSVQRWSVQQMTGGGEVHTTPATRGDAAASL